VTPAWRRALDEGDTIALERALEAGDDVDARDRYGQTGLMLAARRGDHRTVAWLVGHGAALDHTAKSHLSALMLAIVNGHAEVARILVAAGADVTLRGSGAPGFADRTAADLARARGDLEMVDLLEPRG
jgi:ankyrin repeat protein